VLARADAGPTRPEDADRASRWFILIPAAALAARVAIHLATWFSRDFSRDDFYLAYVSWLRAVGAKPGVDFHVFLYSPLEEFLWPLFRLFPESFVPLEIAKGVVFIVGGVLLYTVFRIARVAGASAPWSLAAVSLVAWQKDFGLRISDVRSDSLAILFVLLSLLVLLQSGSRRRWFLAGILLGIGVWFNIKLALAVPAMAVAIVFVGAGEWWRAELVFAGGSLCGYTAFQALRAIGDGWTPILVGLRALFTGGDIGRTSLEEHFLWRAAQGSPGTAILLVAGSLSFLTVALLAWARARRLEETQRNRLVYALWAVLFVGVFLRLYPFVFSYNFVVLMAVLGVLAVGIRFPLPPRLTPATEIGLLLLVSLIPAEEGFRTAEATFGQTNRGQKRVLEWIWKATDPSERVFDWQGMHWGRRGVYDWWIFTGWKPEYQSMKLYDISTELEAARVTLIIDNYRIRWLHPRDRAFFFAHYARLDHCLFAPGRHFTAEEMRTGSTLEVFVPGIYRVDPPEAIAGPLAALLVDGSPAGRVVHLTEGLHTVGAKPPTSARPTRLLYTTPLREKAELPCPVPTNLVSPF
jgi:hypothetical protein